VNDIIIRKLILGEQLDIYRNKYSKRASLLVSIPFAVVGVE